MPYPHRAVPLLNIVRGPQTTRLQRRLQARVHWRVNEVGTRIEHGSQAYLAWA